MAGASDLVSWVEFNWSHILDFALKQSDGWHPGEWDATTGKEQTEHLCNAKFHYLWWRKTKTLSFVELSLRPKRARGDRSKRQTFRCANRLFWAQNPFCTSTSHQKCISKFLWSCQAADLHAKYICHCGEEFLLFNNVDLQLCPEQLFRFWEQMLSLKLNRNVVFLTLGLPCCFY